ncbi:MAG: hypothetical protein O7B26_12750, partial [Planctomycetota bacterium]|nr:hypothetical protein [Planctomycetota bacterium]
RGDSVLEKDASGSSWDIILRRDSATCLGAGLACHPDFVAVLRRCELSFSSARRGKHEFCFHGFHDADRGVAAIVATTR